MKNNRAACLAMIVFHTIFIAIFCSFSTSAQTRSKAVFPSTDSEFSVVFPGSPTLKEVYFEGLKATRAEFVIPAEASFIRAEFAPLSAEIARALSEVADDVLARQGLAYAKANGLSAAETSVGRDSRGRFVAVRGFKTISGVVCTYYNINYYGKNSIILLYAGAPSEKYPTTSINRFLESLKANF